MEDAFVHDLLLPDSNTRRCHVGDACQWAPPQEGPEVTPEIQALIAAHRATIHAPGSRRGSAWGNDEEGNPIETSYLGLGLDPETGETFPLDTDGNRVVLGGGTPPAGATDASLAPPSAQASSPTTPRTPPTEPTTTSSSST